MRSAPHGLHEDRLSAANAEEAKVAVVRYQLNSADDKSKK